MTKKHQVNLAQIQLLVLDVDGVLTDGSLIINPDGSESKTFNTLDGHGIRLWQRAGLKTALLSGRDSAPTQQRAEQLDIEYCLQGCRDKLPALKKLAKELKQKCGTGGTLKDGVIEIQGDHRDVLIDLLKAKGWTVKRSGG